MDLIELERALEFGFVNNNKPEREFAICVNYINFFIRNPFVVIIETSNKFWPFIYKFKDSFKIQN